MPIRKFVKDLNQTLHQASWSINRPIRDFQLDRNRHNSIASFTNLAIHRNLRCTSWSYHNAWSFQIKLMNDITPTIDLLHSRDPSYFNNVNCFFCNRTQESIEHLTTCLSLLSEWHDLITSAVTYTTNKLNMTWNSNIGSTRIIIHIKDNDNLSLPFNNRLAWLRGLIPASFNNILRKHRLSLNKLIKFAHTIRKRILSEFKSNIWLPRCERYKKWMDTQPSTYKQFCLTRQQQTHTHRC